MNYRHFILYFILSVILPNYAYSIPKPHMYILWDMDGVVFEKNKQDKTYKEAISIKRLFGSVLKDCITHPTLLHKICKYRKKGYESEAIERLAEHSGAPHIAHTIHAIINAKKPIKGMPEIIQRLNKQGHQQFVGTNMGAREFATVTTRNPHIFNNYIQPLTDEKHMFLNYELNANPIRKPNPQYFIDWFNKMCKINPQFDKKQVVFIDDKQENIEGAREAGITQVIHFKNPTQLRNDLHSLGLHV